MKKIRKALVMVSLVSSFTFSTTLISMAGQWEQQTDGNWKYKNDDGSYATSSLVDGYYLNSDGIWLEDIKADNGSSGSWKNENFALEMGLELQNSNDWSINPVKIYTSISAGYGKTNDVMNLWKTDDGYDLTLKTRIQSDNTVKGLKAITYLICDDDFLYNAIYNSYEGDNSLYGINYNEFVKVGNYQIKATLGQNGDSMIYTIIENRI